MCAAHDCLCNIYELTYEPHTRPTLRNETDFHVVGNHYAISYKPCNLINNPGATRDGHNELEPDMKHSLGEGRVVPVASSFFRTMTETELVP